MTILPRILRQLTFLLLVVLFTTACKRDTWYNRIYHNTTARFNGYFNARTIYIETGREIEKNFRDDFNNVIPVFVRPDAAALSTNNAAYEQVIKKCSNVIQDHEISKWIDDSFLLIGQAYFMKGEYFEAIETFQYVYTTYKKTELANEALLGLIMAYTESKQFSKAQGGIDLMRSDKRLDDAYKASLAALQADLLLRQKRYDQAIPQLETAIKLEKSKKQRTRYHFILGQLNKESNPKKAAAHFQSCLKGKPYYDMQFQARINMARLYDGSSSLRKARKQLRKLLNDEKNKDYRDEIYYELAMLEKKAGNMPLALEHLKASAASSTKNTQQKTRTYLYLAEYYFGTSDFATAQQYYDSTSTVMAVGHPKFNEVNGKKKFLGELVENLNQIQLQDSLLALGRLPERQLNKIIDQAIKEDERKADQARFEKEAGSNNNFNNLNNSPAAGGLAPPGMNASWYFYNQQAVGQGFSTFKQQWGNRELSDNWRRSKKEQQLASGPGDNSNSSDPTLELNLDPKDPRSKYLALIPADTVARETAHSKIRQAYFNLGNIYRDKLSDYPTAISQFETLLKRYPQCEQIPEALYRLALLYDLVEKAEKAEACRQRLLNDYPRDQYALLIKNPPKIESNQGLFKDEADSLYVIVYQLFQQGKYRETILKSQELINAFPTSSRVPQVEYMSALSLGKTADTSMMKAALAGLNSRYPNSEIGKRAREVLDLMDPAKRQQLLTVGTTEKLFKLEEEKPHYFVFAIEMASYAKYREFDIKLANFNDSNFSNSKLKINNMLYGKTHQFLVVREFPNSRKAMEYYTLFNNSTELLKGMPADKYHKFVISKDNYNKCYDQKLLTAYVEFFKTDYLNTKK